MMLDPWVKFAYSDSKVVQLKLMLAFDGKLFPVKLFQNALQCKLIYSRLIFLIN